VREYSIDTALECEADDDFSLISDSELVDQVRQQWIVVTRD
jgi:hypothetical protein